MKICPACGKELADNVSYCTNCGHKMDAEANNSNNSNNANTVETAPVQPAAPAPEDKANIGLCILSVFIPLVGIILWIAQHKQTPKAARTYGLCGIISWVVSALIGCCSGFALGFLEGITEGYSSF